MSKLKYSDIERKVSPIVDRIMQAIDANGFIETKDIYNNAKEYWLWWNYRRLILQDCALNEVTVCPSIADHYGINGNSRQLSRRTIIVRDIAE